MEWRVGRGSRRERNRNPMGWALAQPPYGLFSRPDGYRALFRALTGKRWPIRIGWRRTEGRSALTGTEAADP